MSRRTRRARIIAYVVALASIVVASVFGAYWRELTIAWYLHQLGNDPAFLQSIISLPEESIEKHALQRFARSITGKTALVRAFGLTDDVENLKAFLVPPSNDSKLRAHNLRPPENQAISTAPDDPWRRRALAAFLETDEGACTALRIFLEDDNRWYPDAWSESDYGIMYFQTPKSSGRNLSSLPGRLQFHAEGYRNGWSHRGSFTETAAFRSRLAPFQAILIDREIMLPDFPGLVFHLTSADDAIARYYGRSNLQGPSVSLDAIAVWFEPKRADPAALPDLVRAAEHGEETKRLEAVASLGRVRKPDRTVLETLHRVRCDPISEVADRAAHSLALLGRRSTSALRMLAAGLDDPDERVRERTIRKLRGLGPHAAGAVDRLRGSLTDSSRNVRTNAASAIGRIGSQAQEAVPDMLRALEDPECDMAHTLLDSLLKVAPNDSRVRQVLEREVTHEDPRRRHAAIRIRREFDRAVANRKAQESRNYDTPSSDL